MKKSYLGMIRAYPGGWDAMAAALGMSRMALENRIYERKGQSVLVETALQMQAFSQTTLFAEAVAHQAGGLFITVPAPADDLDRDDLLIKFNELHAELGDLSRTFNEAVKDGEIDAGEREDLVAIKRRIQAKTAELLALSFQVYCRDE
jgi:hypothetical protein